MMKSFYETPAIKAKRQKLRLELGILKVREKIFGKLSEKDDKRRKEIMRELSIRY